MTAGQQFGFADPFSGSAGWRARYGDQEISQFRAAEMIAEKWDISRAEMEDVRAARATSGRSAAIDEGRFAARDRAARRRSTTDECPRRGHVAWTKMAGAASRCAGAAGSPPRSPARSPTAPPRCWSPPSGRSREHGLTPARPDPPPVSVRAADPV